MQLPQSYGEHEQPDDDNQHYNSDTEIMEENIGQNNKEVEHGLEKDYVPNIHYTNGKRNND